MKRNRRPSARRSSLPSLCPGVLFEPLENRALASAAFSSIDGTGHNLLHPEWGSAGIDFLRIAAADYADGVSAPAGEDRPSAREISNLLSAQSESIANDRHMSGMVYVWGQFIDHDLDLTNTADPAEAFNIAVPTGDRMFDPNATGTRVIPLKRSNFDPATGDSPANPRQQVNSITAWIDGSMVYGSDKATADSLRAFTGGQLKTSDNNLLPLDDDGFFYAGDVRVNENPALTSMQTLFLREHNRIAADIASKNPKLTDEQIFQRARRVVIAEIQAVTYNEFLPALLGPNALRPYRGYRAEVNPGIANEFAAASFRFGHSLLDDTVELVTVQDGEEVESSIPLAKAFFNPAIVLENNIDPILLGVASEESQEVDTHVVDALRNFLFGPPGAGGLDLASLNIQRGRDHGLADYNSTRAAYGLSRVTAFDQITSDPDLQANLQQLYGSVDNIDLWVGVLAENHVPGASVGPLLRRIIADQFTRLRDGDRYYYENMFSGPQLEQLRHTHLADIIRRNTHIQKIQPNVFIAPPAEDVLENTPPPKPGQQPPPPPPPPPPSGTGSTTTTTQQQPPPPPPPPPPSGTGSTTTTQQQQPPPPPPPPPGGTGSTTTTTQRQPPPPPPRGSTLNGATRSTLVAILSAPKPPTITLTPVTLPDITTDDPAEKTL